MKPALIAINSGSSSVKFALFALAGRDEPRLVHAGQVEAVGAHGMQGQAHEHALRRIRDSLGSRRRRLRVVAAGHRVVHLAQLAVARAFALPRERSEPGVKRFGFPGLSYEHTAGVLPRHLGSLAGGKVVVAHLGSGASMCAMRAGRSVATTTGFSARTLAGRPPVGVRRMTEPGRSHGRRA